MITSLVSLVVALGLAVGAPFLLGRGAWWLRRPRLALASWLIAIGVGVLAIVVAVATWLLPTPMWLRPGCGGCTPAGAFFLGCALAVLAGALLALVGAKTEILWRADRAVGSALMRASADSTRTELLEDGICLCVVQDDAPGAFSSRTCGRHIVITSALESQLTPAELRAVIEHERAHLRSMHHAVVMLARVNAVCFPRLRGARQFESRVHLMVELIADDRAARRCGPQDTASALSKLALLTREEGATLRASRLRARSHQPAVLPRAA